METQQHHTDWIELVRKRLGDDFQDTGRNVEALLTSPGWAFVSTLLDDAKQVDLQRLTGRGVLGHGEYIAATRGIRALELCQQVGPVVLHEVDRMVAMAKQRAADEHAASGREEE